MAMACSLLSTVTVNSPALVIETPVDSRTSKSRSVTPSVARCLSGIDRNLSSNCNSVSRIGSFAVGGFRRIPSSQWNPLTVDGGGRSSRFVIKAGASGETALAENKWGPPVQLATGKIPDDVDLKLFENLLFQWGASLTQNANLPLPVPLKVDKIEGGVRLGYVRVVDAKCEDVVHIDVVVFPAGDDQPKAMFRALRNGLMKDQTPPAEPLIMQSLLQALKTAVARSRSVQ
ncbi:hypothetical protein MPTK1_1g14530 [Marchantia polymorpha subsp. ruderalis]|uniref:DUF7148 domain-containing protein n=2 Tax=Marchantia polymorpha TaxID=3197 RepID=A0AAF6AQ56_MARPO|nr:hypothetical protein MARPO_0153s0036 [Marchantia polymorpha]BBM98576.1 hypothetical protein Mp_1g14530 [Marchantia polymorpha subsp. ruderalis]|eukprot:PTQ28873.1 hypothetical protein MARPO_0153s0036 [Marchantia polymorpha]